MSDYIPRLATITEACEWLSEKTGERWTMPRIIDAHVMPWIWLDYSPEAPPEVFGDRFEGFLAPFIFLNDRGRMAIDRQEALMTMTRLPDSRLIRFSPGLRFDLNEIRFKREDVIQLAEKHQSAPPAAPAATEKAQALSGTLQKQSDDAEAQLAALFDPVAKEQLEAMFPDGGKWAGYAERAANNGLASAARESRAMFNPYRAACWWLSKKAPAGWKWERCARVLAKNLPARSLDSRHLLTGDFD